MIKIVCIDDVFTNNKVIENDVDFFAMEKEIEIEFKSFTDPEEGLKFILSNEVDVVFLDLSMPKMDGFQVLKAIRENSNVKQPFIVMVTALGDIKNKEKALELGADGFISKPFDIEEIYEALETYINKASSDSDFIDFDEFSDEGAMFENEFLDFDEEQEVINELNLTHKGISSKEFLDELLKEYGEDMLNNIVQEALELKEDLFVISDLHGYTIKEHVDEVISTLNKLSNFIKYLGDNFSMLGEKIEEVLYEFEDISLIDDEESLDKIAIYLSAFVNELIDWMHHTFENKDSIDVTYANASLYNSLIEIRRLIKEKSGGLQ